MNTERDRPYACSAPGCTQRFPTEDHLMIHRHKHEMSLKLPSIKKDSILSDQTPTPTRFLRSCEEVGLFRELGCCPQTEEDTKQRSVDHSQNQEHTSNHNNSSAQQQAPPSTKATSILAQDTTTTEQLGPVSGLLSCMLYLRAQQRHPQPASKPDSAQPDPAQPDPTLPDSTLPSSASVNLSQIESHGLSLGSSLISSTHHSTCSSPQFPSVPSEARQRLKAALRHHSGSVTNGNINTMGHMMEMTSPQQEQRGRQHLAHTYQQNGHTHSQSHAHDQSGYTQLQSLVNQRHPALPLQTSPYPPEPPQVSAGAESAQAGGGVQAGTPHKRKVWVTSLERKAEELGHSNLQLQSEVTLLKTEVTQLKELLLAHRDCPVTTRQKETQRYPSAESSPAGSH
ncbi:hypothetical protein ANANG_G00185080 [Anguilla anguilla]|uniref:C2H2-type domain-containing protein n=1 Tax=Anguilla anguilla TaxID=7936 RepID=A0A9D3RXQ6_ANGAN|nr:hypothetical protein ANANG_G00185080 [Anguilla anguilla]